MIYSKDVSFPYPVYSNQSNSYANPSIKFSVENFFKKKDYTRINFKLTIESDFLNKLIKQKKVKIYLIVLDYDAKYFEIEIGQDIVDISNKRLSLRSKTSIQVQLVAVDTITFNDCDELSTFYDAFKDEIKIEKYSLVAYSDIATFDGPDREEISLFSYSIEDKLDVPFDVVILEDYISLLFKEKRYLIEKKENLLNMYFYIALEKAINAFYYNQVSNIYDGENIYLSDIIVDDLSRLDFNLYSLMISKNIEELNNENLNKVVHLISDKLIDKYIDTVYNLLEGTEA